MPSEAGPAFALFWFSVAFIGYTYVFYPLAVAGLARLRPRPVARRTDYAPSVSVVIAAFNEVDNLETRVENLLEQDYPADRIEILIVSDGSTDGTDALLERLATHHDCVHGWHLPDNRGKAAALNFALEQAAGELVVFADARQRFAPDAVRRLVEFRRP